MADRIFSEEQIAKLSGILDKNRVKKREGKFSYLEGWDVIDTANKIFGFGNWSRTTKYEPVDCSEAVFKNGKGWKVAYVACVEITVTTDGHTVTRTGCGAGVGMDKYVGAAHEGALKEAETDATKRALATFGNQFGLALYDKTGSQVGIAQDTGDTPTQQQQQQNGSIDQREEKYGKALSQKIKQSWLDFVRNAPKEWRNDFTKQFAIKFETGNRKVSEEITHNAHGLFCQEYLDNNPIPEAAAQ